MYHSLSETRHPLQPEEQEVGTDPLSSYPDQPGGDSNQNGRTSSLDSDGTFNSYRKEWEELFVNNNYLATIRQKGINGQLRSSRFRSICWKLFLCVLPQDKSQWISKIKELRAWYSSIKEIHITNPRKAVGQQDLMINNPLSQDEGSLWNKFFQDKELRSMIEQDVKRTFPEMQFFQQESVRKILTDVLFCYARENEQLLYKQGMHELLAPIVFTLHCDHQAFLHASESAQPRQVFMGAPSIFQPCCNLFFNLNTFYIEDFVNCKHLFEIHVAEPLSSCNPISAVGKLGILNIFASLRAVPKEDIYLTDQEEIFVAMAKC